MDEQHAQPLQVPLTQLFIWCGGAAFFLPYACSTDVPPPVHSLCPPHPEILSRVTSPNFLGKDFMHPT